MDGQVVFVERGVRGDLCRLRIVKGLKNKAYARIEELLEQHGSDKEHILSTTIYLKDISDFAGMNSVWDPWVAKGNEPARACVEAALAAPSIKVEMSVTAAVKD